VGAVQAAGSWHRPAEQVWPARQSLLLTQATQVPDAHRSGKKQSASEPQEELSSHWFTTQTPP
jgi:hypothetical protein